MIETLDVNQLAREICSKCFTSRTCNICKKRHDKKYRIPLVECSIVKNHPTVMIYNARKFADDLAREIAEKDADESDAHQAYCDRMEQLGDPRYNKDTRPDLSNTCGQATEYPCSGCRRENECNEPSRSDSAEIDHNDPINQR